MLRVLPEIGEAVAAKAGIGDAVGGIDDRQRVGLEPGIARVSLETRQAARVLLAHPAQRRLALDLLKPQKRIVVGHTCLTEIASSLRSSQ